MSRELHAFRSDSRHLDFKPFCFFSVFVTKKSRQGWQTLALTGRHNKAPGAVRRLTLPGVYRCDKTNIPRLRYSKGIVTCQGMGGNDVVKMALHIEKVWSRFTVGVRIPSYSLLIAIYVNRLGVEYVGLFTPRLQTVRVRSCF